MIRLGLADDEPLFTAGLAMILDAQPDLRVVWKAIDGKDALRRYQRDAPDVLLLDIQMPGLDGLAVTQRLIAENTTSKIIILTTFEADEYVLTAVEAGAAGFLLKNTPPDQLIDAIRTVHSGNAVISPVPTRKLFATFRTRREPGEPAAAADQQQVAALTPRERDVLILIAAGLTNREICDRLWLSMPTVKTHIGSLIAKTHSRDRVQLVLFAFRSGIVNP